MAIGTTQAVPLARCEEELRRVLASRAFAAAPRLCMLLAYVCEQTLANHLNELTEQQIGMHVFKRSPGYNSGEDTIVRGTARHLRSRLDSYYRDEGKENQVWISVPKGGYVASFDFATASPAKLQLEVELLPVVPIPLLGAEGIAVGPKEERGRSAGWPRSAKIALVCVGLAAVLLQTVVFFYFFTRPKASQTVDSGPVALWKAMFTEGRKTLIVPGDASLDAYVAWEQRGVSLQNYSNQTYQREALKSRPPSGTDVPLAVRSVTPMADLRLVAELVRVPERLGMPEIEGWMEIRYARDIAVADTHNNNLILIGSETFNPWVALYQSQLDFNVRWDYTTDVYSVTDRAPKAGEPSLYTYRRDIPGKKALTLVAFVDNSQGSGHVLMVEGTSMGTTYAALTFLTSQHLWGPVLTAATDKNGTLRNFEVLLDSDLVRGGLSNTRVVGVHVH